LPKVGIQAWYLMPILLPTILALGYDPIWFGIIITLIAVSFLLTLFPQIVTFLPGLITY
jgi:TRAP-type C4-dicarboxylate transport system permease large subunit